MDQGVADDLGVPAAVLAALNGIDLVGAPTSNAEDEWAVARRGAIRVARTAGARLILADVSTRSLFVTPYGSGSTTADTGDSYSAGDRAVDRQELERLGRHYLVEQLGEAATAGVNAEVWLATKPGARSLVMFLERFPIDALVTPPLDDPSLHQRIHGETRARV
jgi:hypothetical protein